MTYVDKVNSSVTKLIKHVVLNVKPERVIIGEVRKKDDCDRLLNALNNAHSGMTTDLEIRSWMKGGANHLDE